MKIGIIGSDKLTHLAASLIKKIEELEISGCYHTDYKIAQEFAAHHQIISYPTLEVFFTYVDAVVINFNSDDSLIFVERCLKHFKHVFLTGAQGLQYENYLRLEKIAEESNVRFYPEFGLNAGLTLENIVKKRKDLLFIDVSHDYVFSEGICMSGRLPALILQDINLILSVVHANVKKIIANGWSFNHPGTGILSIRLDFDNGASSNLLLVNSGKREEQHAMLYYKSEITQVDFIENNIKITTKGFAEGQQKTIEYALTIENSVLHEIKLFQLSVQNNQPTLHSNDNKYKSIRVSHLIQEKINPFTSSHIFYS